MQTGRGKRRARTAIAAAVTALALAAAGCTSDSGEGPGSPGAGPGSGPPDVKGKRIRVAAAWTGAERKNFRRVLDEFEKRTGASVTLQTTGDDVSAFLSRRIQGGQPPDVAFLPQVGTLRRFAEKGWLKQLGSSAAAQLQRNYSPGWQALGAWEDRQYGVYYKATEKSLFWYNASVFENAGVTEPKTWNEFLNSAQTIAASGVSPLSVGAADGRPLTDWFENVYLSQAGPELYDQLANHEIKWTHPSVGEALATLGRVFGRQGFIAGGPSGALQTGFPASVRQTFAAQPRAAMVLGGDFVAAELGAGTGAKTGRNAGVFPFPAVGDRPPVVSGGDVAVALRDGKGAQALLAFLASKNAARISVRAGGFVSPNKELEMSAYPDEVSRDIARSLIDAGDDFRFDMSDQAPAAFGGTRGQGEWKQLRDFLANPQDMAGTQQRLEADAARAYRKTD